ncbi:restriction endonuclease [Alkalimonas collagenimarina]|uniref:Restriction endonuclease n=1 Tax=Alkalimonas collagenimarina TaxID=400390 RepID=A0ABT9GY84_9GAMM|nr:restriction endonuclease [Alkalimonas collagenimarina]MDP4536012.1 restriction endonuclease [Alkalimonas collagenimarina]
MLVDLNAIASELKNNFEQSFKHKDFILSNEFKIAYKNLLSSGQYSLGYTDVIFHRFSAEIITSSSKTISVPNFWFISAAHFSALIPVLHEYRNAVLEIGSYLQLPKNWIPECKGTANIPFTSVDVQAVTGDDRNFELLRNFLTNYDWWKGAKSIDRGDFYVSPILKLGNFLAESQSAVAEIAQQLSHINDASILIDAVNDFLDIAQNKPGNKPVGLHLSKPFILLAGISGTGKSRFVRKQAEAQGSEAEFCQMVPVRPDWHEPSDLLGYVSRIGGAPKFIVTDALRFMVKAWKACDTEAIVLPDGRAGWAGKPLDYINTYWLCLDEMNLAPVEQYFADYLSVIESRSWLYDDDAQGQDYLYCCEPILPASALQVVTDQNTFAKELGLDIIDSPADKQLWDAFLQYGIPVPFNMVVAGTVNMDETTHGFSRKVIDRALTFDFGRLFPNDFTNLWTGQPEPKKLSFSRYSQARPELMAGCVADSDGMKTISFLQAVNDVLRDSPFELAYRALNELLLAVICHSPADEPSLQAVWDDFMMCKVLPRIEGDDEKLSVSSDTVKTENLLDKLEQVLEKQLTAIWSTTRPELLLENANPVLCRSEVKLEWMKNRLERNSFTSFWP